MKTKKIIKIIGNLAASLNGKHIRQKLREEKETLHSILNRLAEGVIVADRKGKFLFFNPVAEQILGVGMQDIDSSQWTSVYGCYYPDRVTLYPSQQLPLARALRDEKVNDELIFIKNSKRPHGVLICVSGRPIKAADGSVCGATVVFQDVTENLHNESELRKLSSAVEQTADTVMITDKKGVIEYVNPAFEITTGYSREQALGQTPKLLQSGLHDAVFYQTLWSTILNGEPYRGTIINKKKNGDYYWSQQTITPMKDQAGKITNFVSVLKDISDLKQKQEQEFHLRIARELQQRYYNVNVEVPGFDIAGKTYPAVETGGDYFDLIEMKDGSIGIVIGDVSGHGIGSALIMTQTRACLRAYAKVEPDPAKLLDCLNQELAVDLDERHFVTLMFARLDPKSRSLEYASAGHLPAYLLKSSGETKQVLESTGIPLGIIEDYSYAKSDPITLCADDMIVFLTDGITEAHAVNKSEFGFARTLDIIRSFRYAPAREIIEQLYRSVRSFTKKQPQEDDITSVVCKVKSDEEVR